MKTETLAERTVRQERELSTRHVKIDLLKEEAEVDIPDKVLELIELNDSKIDFIKECRESRNPMKAGRFPVGGTMVLDTDKLLNDIKCVREEFINQPITTMTTSCMEAKLEVIFYEYLNYHETYTKYI